MTTKATCRMLNGQIGNSFQLLTNEELEKLYHQESMKSIAEKFGISKKTIYNRLHGLPNWAELKSDVLKERMAEKAKTRIFNGICINCGSAFSSSRKRKYCSSNCIKACWTKKHRKENSESINKKRRQKRLETDKRITERQKWKGKYLEVAKLAHKRKLDSVAEKLLIRSGQMKNSLVSRSKKYGVECNITLEEVRQLVESAYGKPCKYCGRQVTIKNLTVDHIIPMSKGGNSNIDNLQIICKASNTMKGSLDEKSFNMLLEWLDTVPPELKKDISIRLARGIH